ncbi:MAG: MaoC family dehydratase N-terminal domain-containing protein, partial [Burkholderiaceae bacterium]|nr:MaoC family dehydratase N-terminal domain-containing protein [Burkholderiaceae bacterium]
MLEPTLDWSSLAEGRVFPAVPIVLDEASIDAYLEATGESHPLYARQAGGGLAPPFFTTMVRFVKASLGGRWPSGTIQLDHRVSLLRALRRGESLTLDARCGRIDSLKGQPRFEILSTLRDGSGAVAGTQSSASLWAGPPPAPALQAPGSTASTASTVRNSAAPCADGHGPADASAALGPLTDIFPMARVRAFGEVARALDPIHVDTAFARGTR